MPNRYKKRYNVEIIADVLKTFRKNNNISLEEMSKMINISVPRLSIIENKKCDDIRVNTYYKIMKAVDISHSQYVIYDASMENNIQNKEIKDDTYEV